MLGLWSVALLSRDSGEGLCGKSDIGAETWKK